LGGGLGGPKETQVESYSPGGAKIEFIRWKLSQNKNHLLAEDKEVNT